MLFGSKKNALKTKLLIIFKKKFKASSLDKT